MNDLQAALALEDGKIFYGKPFGAIERLCHQFACYGEVIFTTAMTGYQEICTDPSYRKQIVVMTYPLIGNYGVAKDDIESRRPWLTALVVHDLCETYSHWQAQGSLDAYLASYNIPGIAEVDTRALTRHLRTHGTAKGILYAYPADAPPDEKALCHAASQSPSISTENVVDEVSLFQTCSWASLFSRYGRSEIAPLPEQEPVGRSRMVIIDAGFKFGIARYLADQGLEIIVVPYTIRLPELFALRPAGVLLSNGPGDPMIVHSLITLTQHLIPSGVPLMGICLGHQIIGLAAGAHCSKLVFGHHGTNHPVKDMRTGRVTITSQNHNFQVDAQSIPSHSGFHISHKNLLDQSVEGLYHEHYPVCSIQFHPEASPGPHDNLYLLDTFIAQLHSRTTSRLTIR